MLKRRGAADDAVDLVALLEQQLGEVRAVLPRDAGDQGAPGALCSIWFTHESDLSLLARQADHDEALEPTAPDRHRLGGLPGRGCASEAASRPMSRMRARPLEEPVPRIAIS